MNSGKDGSPNVVPDHVAHRIAAGARIMKSSSQINIHHAGICIDFMAKADRTVFCVDAL